MLRILFFFMGVPMMIMSFFEAVDVLPYVAKIDLMTNGNSIELSQEQEQNLYTKVCELFKNSRTMPAFGVVFDNEFQKELQNGTYISLKFNGVFEVNELPFDELVFKVEPDWQGFNLMRGMKGVFEGRCIYINLQDKDMSQLNDLIAEITTNSNVDNEIGDNEEI